MTDPLPFDEAYLVIVHVTAVSRHELWQGGQLMQSGPTRPGDMTFCDMRTNPAVWLSDPFRLLAFYVPRAALGELSNRKTMALVNDVRCLINDPIVSHLGRSLAACLSSIDPINQLYVDHALLALTIHLGCTYGSHDTSKPIHRGGLAPWQRRRAQDLLHEHLTAGISLERLSQACSLSPSAFLRGFRKSTGLPPHQWLLARRVDRATELIRQGMLPLSEIALSSGFSDQSHFTRVFSQQMGVSPGVWRRAQSAALAARTGTPP